MLKRIELQGFKSFRDKTVINFEHGYTAIVGPNGCGKSNVSDAIRWVLGEQSAKQLRGTNMKGVIFAGTATLPEMGYAEVTLVFDNSDGMFRTTYEELSITRKIFRSKPDNYYYINHKPCRRQDIIEIMRDTGAGRESLSIIEQGAVAEIMKVKPEDRRRIFDEAAGIALAKSEKRSNLRLLESTNNGIMTLMARLEEMDKQLTPLRRQVEAVIKYEEFREQLRVLEYNMFIYKYENADRDKSAIRAHITELDEYIADNEREVERCRRRKEQIDVEQNENDRVLHGLYDSRTIIRENRARLSGDQQAHKAKLESLQTTLATLEENLEANREANATVRVELAEAQQVLAAKRTEKFDREVEVSVVNADYNAVTAELEESERGIELGTSAQIDTLTRLAGVQSDAATAQATVNVLHENMANADKEIASARASMQEEQQAIDTARAGQEQLSLQYERNNAAYQSRAQIINESRYRRAELERRIKDMEQRVQAKEINVQSLRNYLRDKKGYSKSVAYIVKASAQSPALRQHFIGIVSDLYEAAPDYAEAIEVALGASANHIVTRNQDDANYIFNVLKAANMGRATCLPLNRLKTEGLAFEYRGVLREHGVLGVASDFVQCNAEAEGVFRHLLGRIVIVDSHETGKRIDDKYRRGIKMVTLDGEVFDPSGTMSGGSRKSQEDVALDRERKELELLKKELQTLTTEREKIDRTIASSEEFMTTSREKQDELNRQYSELTASIKSHETALALLENRVREAEATKAYTAARLRKLEADLAEAQSAGDAIKTGSTDGAAQVEQAKASKESIKVLREALGEQRSALNVAISALATEISNIERDVKRMSEELARTTAAVEGLGADIEAKKEEIKRHEEARPELQFSEEEGAKLEQIESQITACLEKKEALREALAKANQQQEELTERVLLSTNERTKLYGKIEKIDTELAQWTQKIYEDYEGRTYEDIADQKAEDFDHVKAPGAMAVLRANITKLGPINHAAKEQYETLSADRQEVSRQMEDAVRGKENIEMMIAKITAEMNAKFAEAFAKINENFSDTFTDLFGGGSASLELIDNPDNPDEQGVDIVVQLPGKSKGPLTRLSGGEQSLTAIAILFAILKLKPMPFVVLDEVESALDEVNCNRFALFLKKYANTSRFVVITHKKPTMGSADVIFGVTMQQPGVSNIVSVSLSDAVKHVWED
ncbi:MAG: chromosome segregation protein SMC [Clostridia bacterium]|nr:chromosome segregation protein SMC [Clostridia bacterium]